MFSDSTREKVLYIKQDFSESQKWKLSVKQLATRLASLCICEKENFLYNYFGYQVLLWWEKRTPFLQNFCYHEKNNRKRTLKKEPNKKNFSLKMCYFVNISCKESNLQYTSKLICSSICNILLLLPFLRQDQLKWDPEMTVIFRRKFSFSAGNVLQSVRQ